MVTFNALFLLNIVFSKVFEIALFFYIKHIFIILVHWKELFLFCAPRKSASPLPLLLLFIAILLYDSNIFKILIYFYLINCLYLKYLFEIVFCLTKLCNFCSFTFIVSHLKTAMKNNNWKRDRNNYYDGRFLWILRHNLLVVYIKCKTLLATLLMENVQKNSKNPKKCR